MRPRIEPLVAIAVSMSTLAKLSSCLVERDTHKELQISHPASVRFAFEHPVILHDRVDVLDSTASKLEPFVLGDFLG